MDERITTILKALAYGEIASNDGENYCLYCDFDDYAGPEKEGHELTCPIILARAILKEQGMPLLMYRIDFEGCNAYRHNWYATYSMVSAFSEQEALQGFEDSPDLDDLRNSKKRNARATLLREVL